MARTRNLKPSFFKSLQLAECEPLARILFEGLWCLADKEGRLKDQPKLIRAEILPYDNCDIEALLGQLATNGLIQRYEVQGLKCILIPTFKIHQNPHPKEAQSQLPDIDGKLPAVEITRKETESNLKTDTSPAIISYPSIPSSNPYPLSGTPPKFVPKTDFDIRDYFGDDDLMKAKGVAPGKDIYPLISKFNDGVNSGKLTRPQKPVPAFIAWIPSYLKQEKTK